MKLTLPFITLAVAILLTEESSSINSFQKDKNSACNNDASLWQQGKVPFEISQQFVGKDLDLIKEALLDIMNTTCIKFVPHTNEPDYVVFVEYNHPNQDKKKTCWSGNQLNNGNGTVGNRNGRHFVALWRELECFNKLDIIRHMFNILGFQTKSSTLISKGGSSIIHAAYNSYEDDPWADKVKQRNAVIQLCDKESVFLRKYPYAFDKKEWVGIAKKQTCSTMRATIQINQIYNCSSYDEQISISSANNNDGAVGLSHVRPNCKTEAEAGACKSDPAYMNTICDKSFCDGWGVKYGNTPPSPRMANLINGYGKGFNVYWDQPNAGWTLLQWATRGSYSKGNIWSWNEATLGSGDRHLCNGFGKCATSEKTNVLANNGTLDWGRMGWVLVKQWDYSDDESKRFYFLDSLTHPGFYIIKDEFGKCIGVPENTDRNGAELWACFCNSSDASQRWQWHYLDDKIKGASLINGLGKCLNSGDKPGHHDIISGISLHQWDCVPSVNTMIWSWNQVSLGSKDRHICDADGFCVATPSNSVVSQHLVAFYHTNEQAQRFTFVDLLTHPGFYFIKNDHGKCLSVKGNTNQNGAEIWADDCNSMEAGQRWKWQ